MDDGGHRENGRHKQDQYKAVHNQWMIPQHHMKEHHASMMKQMMAIMAERDAAIQERNMALAKEKAALAERDMAILQRDAAISERNNALVERENAIAALEYRENAMNGNGAPACPPSCGLPRGTKHVHHPQHSNRSPHLPEGSYNTREMHISEAFPISEASPVSVKHRRVKESKETEAVPLPLKKTSKRKGKRGGEDLNKQITIAKEEWDNGQDIGGDGGHLVKSEWRGQELGLNEVAFDESTMPVPVCSCTGEFKQCYKWGNGGWQSSCCTTAISMYPLPVMANRRHARVGGRKMSGGVFNKLLSRLAAEGHDLSTPLDLKDHWAKHGTNRYITIK